MSQTRVGSAAEAGANILVGFAINWTANLLVLPLFGFHVTGAQAFGIGLVFTVISLVRQYVLRRWFNGLRFGNGTYVVTTNAVDGAKSSYYVPDNADRPAPPWPTYDGGLAPVESLGREHGA